MKILKIDYSFIKILNNILATKEFKVFLDGFEQIVSQDKETKIFLNELYTEK